MNGEAYSILSELQKKIKRPNQWDELFKERNPLTIKLQICVANSILAPKEMFTFLQKRIFIEDISNFYYAIEIVEGIADKLDIKKIISEVQESEDAIYFALINAAIPMPIDEDNFTFLCRSAISQYPTNRESFLKTISKAVTNEMTPKLFGDAAKIVEKMGNDKSPLVQIAWIDPAIMLLKGNTSLSKHLIYMCNYPDIEVRKALASRFDKIIEVEKKCDCLINDKKPVVIAALIPRLQYCQTSRSFINGIKDHLLMISVLRFVKDLDESFLKSCYDTGSLEVHIQLMKTLQSMENPDYFVQRFLDDRLKKSELNEREWRFDIELLCFNDGIINKYREKYFMLALIDACRHPKCLQDRAFTILEMLKEGNEEEIRKVADNLISQKTSYEIETGEKLLKLINVH